MPAHDSEKDKNFILGILERLRRDPVGRFHYAERQSVKTDDLAAVQPWGRFTVALGGGAAMKFWRGGDYAFERLAHGDVLVIPELAFARNHPSESRVRDEAISFVLRDNHLRVVHNEGPVGAVDMFPEPVLQYYIHDTLHPGTRHAMLAFFQLGAPDFPHAARVDYYRALLAVIAHNLQRAERQRYHKSYRSWIMVVDYIERHYDHPLTRRNIGQALRMSESHLSKLFRRYAGLTLHDFQLRIRLAKAVELLKDPTLTVAAIGHLCGFGTTSFFIKQFREAHGATPGQYRTRGP